MEREDLYAEIIETFDIPMDSSSAEIDTAGALYDYVLWKLGLRERDMACLCPPTFFTLRRALVEILNLDKKAVTPNTKLAALMPLRGRPKNWQRLSAHLGWEFPDLAEPPGLVVLVAFLWALGVFPACVALFACLDLQESLFIFVGIPLVLLSQIPFALVMMRVCRPLQRRFPGGCRTVGELVETLVALNAPRLREQFASSLPDQSVAPSRSAWVRQRCTQTVAFLSLRRALADSLGMAARSLRPATPLSNLLPVLARRRVWLRLERALRWRLPALRRSPWVVLLCVLSYPAIIGACAAFGPLGFAGSARLLWWLLIPYCALAYQVTLPLAVRLPEACATLGGLSQASVNRNYGRIAKQNASADANEVWSVVRHIVAEHQGCEVGNIRHDMPLFGE